MFYPFMTLEDNTEIVHSDYMADGKVKVYIERPDENDCFHRLTCYLPSYELEDVYGFSEEEINKYLDIIRSTAHLIIEARSAEVVDKWYSFYGEIKYYC